LANISAMKRKTYKNIIRALVVISLIQLPIKTAFASLTLNAKMEGIPLAESLLVFEDPEGKKTLEEIAKMPESYFSHLKKGNVNMGYSNSTFWFRLTVINPLKEKKDWIFKSEYPLLDYISIYIPAEFGYHIIHAGDRLPFSSMPYGYFNFITRIRTNPGTSTIFIKIKSEGSLIAKFSAWDDASFNQHLFNTITVFWLFNGIMIALLIYSLFIFISTKDKLYFWLFTLIGSTLMFVFIHSGMARKYLWGDSPFWANYSHPFFIFIAITSLSLFTRNFFNTKLYIPTIDKLLIIFSIISAAAAFVIFSLPYTIATQLSVIFTISGAIILTVFTAIPMIFKTKRLALYYLFSWSLFTLGALLLALRSYGFIHESFISAWSFQVNLTSGIVFISIAVASKINYLQKQNQQFLMTLRESEERYRLFFETAHDAIVFFIDETPAYANKNMIKMSAYSEEEFYKKNLKDFFPYSVDPDISKIIEELKSKNEKTTKFEHTFTKKNGETIPVLISLSMISSTIHNGFLMIISDISDIKKAYNTIKEQFSAIQNQLRQLENLNREVTDARNSLFKANEELQKEKEFLSATLISIGDGVISCNTAGEILFLNRAAEEITGFKSTEAYQMHLKDIIQITDADERELFFDTLVKFNDSYDFYNIGIPFRITDKSGNEKVIELNSALIKINNEPAGFVIAMRDVTIKSRIDNELIKISKLESIGILAGGIAHDFNNLLTGISGNVSLARNSSELPSTVKDYLKQIEKAVSRATDLTRQLLTFAKGGNPVIEPYNIEDIIRESVNFILKDKFIKTEIKIAPDIMPVLIDPNQISQAINNLLINAMQAMPQGGNIFIEAKNAKTLPPEIPNRNEEFVSITIKDTGCGIPQKDLAKIFDPFFTTKPRGTGFGLTSTYSIIKKHKGYILVDSILNKGTTFTIYLKTAKDKPKGMQKTNNIAPLSKQASILIMDDEDFILDILYRILIHNNYEVTQVKNGEEAIKIYKERLEAGKPFDLLILDLTIYGGMGGKETLDELLKINPEVKAIVSSGYSDNPVMAHYKEYGFCGILAKPYVVEDVLSLLHTILPQE